MVKLFLIGFILISIIGLGTFGVLASGLETEFMNDDNWHMGQGGRHMHDDYDQDDHRYGCSSDENRDCGEYHIGECEEYCEENGYEREDCPGEHDDCQYGSNC